MLGKFCQPYYGIFQHVDGLLSSPSSSLPANSSLPLLAESLLLLTELFHDLSSQDLPPFFEDHLNEFMGAEGQGATGGWLLKYLSWEREELKGDVSFPIRVTRIWLNDQEDDEAPGPLQRIRASICEIAELYAQKYLDAFPQLGSFVNGVWNMLTTLGPGARNDMVSLLCMYIEPMLTDVARLKGSALLVGGGPTWQSTGDVWQSRYAQCLLREDHLAEYELAA